MTRALILVPVLAVLVTATVLFLTLGQTRAVQAPKISLDMDGSTNTYTPSVDNDFDGLPDPGTNVMSVGTIENCFTHAAGDGTQHLHGAPVAGDPPVQLVIQNVEDVVGYQARINFDGTKLAITSPTQINHSPYTDGTKQINFLNLPVDLTTMGHKDLFGTSDIQPPGANDVNATALIGSAALGVDSAGTAPDVPSKAPHDQTTRTYDATGGGVLAQLQFVVRAGQVGQTSLRLDLDDASPNSPGSKVDIFTATGTQTMFLGPGDLGDGFVGEGAACVALQAETPNPTPTPSAIATPTPTPAGTGGTTTGATTPAGAGAGAGRTGTPTRGPSPAALPPTGGTGHDGWDGDTVALIAALAISASGAAFVAWRLRGR